MRSRSMPSLAWDAPKMVLARKEDQRVRERLKMVFSEPYTPSAL